jgi:hypothetical protein
MTILLVQGETPCASQSSRAVPLAGLAYDALGPHRGDVGEKKFFEFHYAEIHASGESCT